MGNQAATSERRDTQICRTAINYEDKLEFAEDKTNVDFFELEWNTASDARAFGILQNREWLYEAMIAAIDEATSVGDNKKKLHAQKKGVEIQITSIRKLKNENKELIEREQRFINEADSTLELSDEIRGKNT